MDASDTTLKTLYVVDALFRHRKERHCHHTVEFIVKEALTKSKSAGLAAQTQQPTDGVISTQRSNPNGNYTRT